MKARWELSESLTEARSSPLRWKWIGGALALVLIATAVAWHFGGTSPGTDRAGNERPVRVEVSEPAGGDASDGLPPAADPVAATAPAVTPEALRDSALTVVQQLIADLPGRSEPVALLALVHNRYGRQEAAIQCWKRCLEIDAGFADAYHGLGSIALEQGDHPAAEAYVRKALDLRPDLPEARLVLANALLGQAKLAEAAAVLEEEVQRFPGQANTVFRLGQTYAQLGRHAEARGSLEQALAIDPSAAYPYFALASVCARLDDQEAAARYRNQFAERKQQALEGERERLKQFDDVKKMRSSAAFFHTAAGSIYLRFAQRDKAEQCWRLAGAIDPEDQDSRLRLVELYERNGRRDQALAMLEELRQIDPHSALYTVNLALLRASQGQFDAAEELLQQGIRQMPDAALLHAALAQLYLESGRDQIQARALAQSAIDRQPSAGNYALLAAACQQLGDITAALAAVEQALALEPQNAHLQAFARRLRQTAANDTAGTAATTSPANSP